MGGYKGQTRAQGASVMMQYEHRQVTRQRCLQAVTAGVRTHAVVSHR
jgi:hypothetical protein